VTCIYVRVCLCGHLCVCTCVLVYVHVCFYVHVCMRVVTEFVEEMLLMYDERVQATV
jgi:hypothetical protein